MSCFVPEIRDKTILWKSSVIRKHLFYKTADKVQLEKYRNNKKKNLHSFCLFKCWQYNAVITYNRRGYIKRNTPSKNVTLTFWHRSFTFNSNKSSTWCNNFSIYYPDVCLQFNMFRAFFRPSSGAQWLQWQSLDLPSYRGDSPTVFVVGPAGRPARPRTQHDCHHDTKVKPEAATAVIEFLMLDGKTPETCWAVNKRQDNKLKNCCIRLVICLNCTMMHGLTNHKFYI
jgi:hypothetical protein